MGQGNNNTPVAIVHERYGNAPMCGARSLSMGDTQEVTCNTCLLALRNAMSTELARVCSKLAQPPMGGDDKVQIHIHIIRADGKESHDPVIIPGSM